MCALSPWAIVAVILMLASDRPSNARWWLVGWTLSTFAIGVLIVLFFEGFDFSGSTTPSKAVCILQVLLGGLLLVAAGRFWARRPARTGKLPTEPAWMARIGTMSPMWAFLIGAFWINTTLVVAAGIDTLRSELSTGQSIAAFAVFTVITSSVQGALILYARLLPERAALGLQGIRQWIARNQQAALAVVALVLAVWLAGQGLHGLLGSPTTSSRVKSVDQFAAATSSCRIGVGSSMFWLPRLPTTATRSRCGMTSRSWLPAPIAAKASWWAIRSRHQK